MSASVSVMVWVPVTVAVWVLVWVWALVSVSVWVSVLVRVWVREAPHPLGGHLQYRQTVAGVLFPAPGRLVGCRVRQDGPRFNACN